MAKMETVKYTQRKMYAFMLLNCLYSVPVSSSLCLPFFFFFPTICEEIIPWISVVQSMKVLGPKYRFSNSFLKSTIGRVKRK